MLFDIYECSKFFIISVIIYYYLIQTPFFEHLSKSFMLNLPKYLIESMSKTREWWSQYSLRNVDSAIKQHGGPRCGGLLRSFCIIKITRLQSLYVDFLWEGSTANREGVRGTNRPFILKWARLYYIDNSLHIVFKKSTDILSAISKCTLSVNFGIPWLFHLPSKMKKYIVTWISLSIRHDC